MCIGILDIITFGGNLNGRMPHFKLSNFEEIVRPPSKKSVENKLKNGHKFLRVVK